MSRLRLMYRPTNYMLNGQCVQQSPSASQIHVVVPVLFLQFWALCTQAQLNLFYHPFYPDITHVRKDTRPSPAFPYCKLWKAGRGLGTRLGGVLVIKVSSSQRINSGRGLGTRLRGVLVSKVSSSQRINSGRGLGTRIGGVLVPSSQEDQQWGFVKCVN